MIPKIQTAPTSTRPRIVLDTNVCLDLFVFRDPRWHTLHEALLQGEVQAVTRADCRKEWSLVLAYEKLQLDEARRLLLMTEFDALITLIDVPPTPRQDDDIKLPVCRDPDDQKFLELARMAGADVLISKDKALLKLARKTAKAGLFRIMEPQAWVADAIARHNHTPLQ